MHRSFEQWSQDLEFSEELDIPLDDDVEDTSPANLTQAHTEPFVRLVTRGILEKLSDPDFLDTFLNARELTEDNRLLASQVKHLIKEKKELEAQLAQARQDVERFKRVTGNIYLRLD